MVNRPATRLLGLLLIPALLASGAAQGLLLYRCTSGVVRMSCCCPEKHEAPPVERPAQLKSECCDKIALPPADSQQAPREAPTAPAPVHTVAIRAAAAVLPPLVATLSIERHASAPPARPSAVITNCSWLI